MKLTKQFYRKVLSVGKFSERKPALKEKNKSAQENNTLCRAIRPTCA